jgi:hypothetical protein
LRLFGNSENHNMDVGGEAFFNTCCRPAQPALSVFGNFVFGRGV